MNLGNLCSQSFLIVLPNTPLCDIITLLTHQDTDYIIVFSSNKIQKIFSVKSLFSRYLTTLDKTMPLTNCETLPFITFPSETPISILSSVKTGICIITTNHDKPNGVFYYDEKIHHLLHHSHSADASFNGFRQVFENIEEEIVVSTADGTIAYLNPMAEKLIGFSTQDLVGISLKELVKRKIFYPSAALEVLKTHKKVNMQTTLKDGEERLSTAVPIFDQNGELKYTVCTSKNVGEILKLNQQLFQKKVKLKQKDQEIERMQKKEFENMNFYFESPQMYQVMRLVKRIAPLNTTVLIQGETGVGKGIIAKCLHYLSQRNHQPFVKINCGLIPENLIESELFGYESGAFSGASKNGKIGKVEMANGGTLFLDEIGDMPLSLQIKLLDFIQDATFTRVGGVKTLKADVRIISATNKDLLSMVNDGQFRQDLYYRLNVFNLMIPPLHERIEDIPELVEFFIKKFNTQYGLNKHLSTEVIYDLYHYSWPGNVRELENTLERILLMSESSTVTSSVLSEALTLSNDDPLSIICNNIIPYKEAKMQLEKILIQKAYEQYGSTYKAAKALQIDQSTVSKLMKKYHLKI